MQKHLRVVQHVVKDEADEKYYAAKHYLTDMQEQLNKTNKKELERENKRIFGRLVNILDVSNLHFYKIPLEKPEISL